MSHKEEGFSFQLEEVLSFERGQEVGDMISVFLDPDITVQSLKEDISIRGTIELQGEYERVDGETEYEEHMFNEDTFEQRNYVDKVVDIGEERAIFSHHFPVEISIPHYRVTKLEDISLDIEHFDYEIIAPDEMKVQSSILIRGVSNEEREYTSLDTNEENEPLFTIIDHDDAEENVVESSSDIERSSLTGTEEPEVDVQEMEEIDSERETERMQEGQEKPVEEEQVDLSTRSQEETETIIGSKTVEDDGEVEDQDKRNIDYLTSMFGDEDQSRHTKMRLCIVQERDTVDSIAERYNVQSNHIVKKNRLENEELVEGQLLQIPLSSNN